MIAGAAIFRRVELRARALARHYRPGVRDLQLLGAVGVDVGDAAGVLAVAGSAGGADAERHIVAVDEADVVEVLVGGPTRDGELCQTHRWRAAGADGALERAAVAGDALSVTVTVEIAAGSGPEPAGPPRRSLKLFAFSGGQLKATLAESGAAVAGKCSRPHRVSARVMQGENRSRNIHNS